jgi:hypothetical protein
MILTQPEPKVGLKDVLPKRAILASCRRLWCEFDIAGKSGE